MKNPIDDLHEYFHSEEYRQFGRAVALMESGLFDLLKTAKTTEDLFTILQQKATLNILMALQERTQSSSHKDSFLLPVIDRVLESNIEQFETYFMVGQGLASAQIISYKADSGNIFYHADYVLSTGEKGWIIKFFENSGEKWETLEKQNSAIDYLLIDPIGKSINKYFHDNLP